MPLRGPPNVVCRPAAPRGQAKGRAAGARSIHFWRAEDALQTLEDRGSGNLFFLLLLAGWVNTIPICLRAVSSASAERSAQSERLLPGPPRTGRARDAWTCWRMLNSSGQDCWMRGRR